MQIKVCIGSACHINGSYNVINMLQQLVDDADVGDKVEISAAFCLGHCSQAVSVQVDEGEVYSVNSKTVKDFFNNLILPKVL